MVGTKIDSYELVKELGRGAMGVVFLARHDTTGREVALKLLHPDRAGATGPAAQAALERFQREARAMGAVAHSENVVSILDAGLDAGTGSPFLVMELLKGEDVEELSGRLGPLPVGLALRVVAQALSGLVPAHEAGIVHRDLKPSNLFLMKRAEGGRTVKVLDFGIAKLREGTQEQGAAKLTADGTALGSPAYMSPEQVQASKALDVRSDVWSMGVLLYQLLSGKVPFAEAETLRDLLMAIVLSSPQPVSHRAPWVPRPVQALVERATQIDPAGRYANAREMRDAIVRVLGGMTAPGTPDGALLVITDAMIEPLSAQERQSQVPVSAMAVSVPGAVQASATVPMSAVPSGALAVPAPAGVQPSLPPLAVPPVAEVPAARPFSFPTQPSAGVVRPGRRGASLLGLAGGAALAVGLVVGTVMLLRPSGDRGAASIPLPTDAGEARDAMGGARTEPPEPPRDASEPSRDAGESSRDAGESPRDAGRPPVEPTRPAPTRPAPRPSPRPSAVMPAPQPDPKVKTIE